MPPTRRPHSPLLLVLAFAVAGCATWRPYDTTPALGAGQSLPHRLRATRQDRTRVALTAPFVRADTLYGRVHGDTVAVPIAEITQLERERLNLGRTLGVVIGVPALALGVIYLIECGDSRCQPTY